MAKAIVVRSYPEGNAVTDLRAKAGFYLNYSDAGGFGGKMIILATMQRRTREIVQGQRYRKIGAGGGMWEVVAVRADEEDLGIAGVHLFTFNQVEATEAWVRRAAAS